MSKDTQFLEKVKYYLFLKTTWRIIFSGHGNYLDKSWDFDGQIDLSLPENINITTSLISSRLELMVSAINVNSAEADKSGYNRRHIPLNLFTSIDDLNNIPQPNIDAGVFCYHNTAEGYKRYVFAFEDYYDKFPTYLNESRIVAEVKQYLHYEPSYASLFRFALTIHVRSASITAFENFLSMPFGDETTPNTWKYFFNQAVVSAKAGDHTKITKYDPSIVSQEISLEDRKYLLTNFWTLNMEPELLLALLTPPKYDDVTARQIYQHLQFGATELLLALWNYFEQRLTTEANNPFSKFNQCLMELSQTILTSDDVETIGVKEVEVYQSYTGQWNLFHKLAQEAHVFAHCMNQYQTGFGIMRLGAEPPGMEPHPFSPLKPNTINLSYRAFDMSPPNDLYTQTPSGFYIPPFISFNEFDAFKFVKVYLVEKPQQISGFNNYEKFISLLFSDPQDAPTEGEKEDENYVRFMYMPAICAYNLYLMNNYNLHVEIRTYLITAAITAVGVYLSFINVARFSLAWYLATGTSAVAITSLTINAPGVRQEILDNYGAEGQEFLDAWDVIETATLALNFAYIGFYGARSLYGFVSNIDEITISLEKFSLRYAQLSEKLRKILKPLKDSFFKLLNLTKAQYDDYLVRLEPLLQNGKTYQWILDYKNLNGVFPPLSSYIKPNKLTEYLTDLQADEVAFFISKAEITESTYLTLPASKFAGLTPDMDKILLNFNKSGKSIQQLIDDLKVAKDKFVSTDEIFLVKVKMNQVHPNTNFQMDMPTGNEPGVNVEFFRPGGILPTVDDLVNVGQKIYPREAIIKNANSMAHNNDWNTFKSIFGNSNVTQIYP